MDQTPESPAEMTHSDEGGSASRKKPFNEKQIKLKKDLNTMVSNIQAAAEAREVQWRTEIDKARKTRLELLEEHSLSSKDKIEEISKGWYSAKEKVIPEEVQAALLHQQQLCAEIITEKNKIIDAIQQDLKATDDSFVADLKKQAEELQLMLERMMEQDNTLTKAYRDELEQWKETTEKEEETKRTEEKGAWEQCMKKLLDTEVEKLQRRQQAVEKYDSEIYHMILEITDNFNIYKKKEIALFQSHELELQQAKSERIFMEHKIKKQKAETAILKAEGIQLEAKMSSVKSEITKLRVNEQSDKRRREKEQMEKNLKELNHRAQENERIQKKLLHFAVADTVTFKNMWLTLDAEVKELVDRALYVDSMVSEQVLHLLWEPPNFSFLERNKQGSNTNIADQWSIQSVEAHDMSKEEAYWDSMGNVITPEKLKLWEATKKNLEKHHAVLSEISELNQEIQSLQQENTELQMVCMRLQQVDQPLSLNLSRKANGHGIKQHVPRVYQSGPPN